MSKITPDPPHTDPASPYEPDSNKLNAAAECALDLHLHSTADIKATPRTPSTLFIVDPQVTTAPCWAFPTASCWRKSRRTGCWIRSIRPLEANEPAMQAVRVAAASAKPIQMRYYTT